ncbi:flagellin [Brevundimonas sp.]|uniref:flagellin n=1 Tax=Brevundimonas sp. TaxID=1871086 RepID=UPI002731C9C1|nr:flagellin [Brevundimonas sp.]MDP1913957.1 flagellin [Brevundimonas sp.]
MANSINTNAGALVALQSLNATSRELDTVQNRVNTGLKVASAKDNGAIFAIASGLRAEQGALNSVKNSIQRGQSVIDVALAAGDTITKALEEQKGLAVAIQSSVAGSAAETAYLADFNALGTEITAALAGANFDGINLFSAGSATNNLVVQTGTASTYTVHGAAAAATTVSTATTATRTTATAANVETANTAFAAKLGTLGSNSKSLERQLTFTSKIQDALEAGVGNLVDADLAKESARLTALQTKQQLGVQALSIANQSSSILLGLFR